MTGINPLMNPLDASLANGVSFTLAAEAANMIAATVTFTKFGSAIAETGAFKAWLSSDAAGLVPSSAPSGGVAVGGTAGSLGAILEDIADVSFTLICNASGVCQVNVTDSGTSTIYLNVADSNGRIYTKALPFA